MLALSLCTAQKRRYQGETPGMGTPNVLVTSLINSVPENPYRCGIISLETLDF